MPTSSGFRGTGSLPRRGDETSSRYDTPLRAPGQARQRGAFDKLASVRGFDGVSELFATTVKRPNPHQLHTCGPHVGHRHGTPRDTAWAQNIRSVHRTGQVKRSPGRAADPRPSNESRFAEAERWMVSTIRKPHGGLHRRQAMRTAGCQFVGGRPCPESIRSTPLAIPMARRRCPHQRRP